MTSSARCFVSLTSLFFSVFYSCTTESERWYYFQDFISFCFLIKHKQFFSFSSLAFFLFDLLGAPSETPHYTLGYCNQSKKSNNRDDDKQHRGTKSSIFSSITIQVRNKQHREAEIDNSSSMCLWKSYWKDNVSRKNFFRLWASTLRYDDYTLSIFSINARARGEASASALYRETTHNFPHFFTA